MTARLSAVQALFRHRGPANISWLVVSVVVDAINRVLLRWPMAHVFEEGLERVHPAFTDADAPASVVRVGVDSRVVASALHVLPDAVLGRSPHTGTGIARMAMPARSGAGQFMRATAARLCVPGFQVRLRDDRRAAAVALAPEISVLLRQQRLDFFDRHQSPKPTANQLRGFAFTPRALTTRPRAVNRFFVQSPCLERHTAQSAERHSAANYIAAGWLYRIAALLEERAA